MNGRTGDDLPRELTVTGNPGVISQGNKQGSANSVSFCLPTESGHTIHAELPFQQARCLVRAFVRKRSI